MIHLLDANVLIALGDATHVHAEAARIPALSGSQQLTDGYLLALTASQSGFLASFDRNIDLSCVKGGRDVLLVLGKPD